MAATIISPFPINIKMKMKLSSNIALSKFQTHEFHPSYSRVSNNSRTQTTCSLFNFQINAQKEPNELVEDLRVPNQWLDPSNALQKGWNYTLMLTTLFEESEWLRVTLHKWLDDEYCPEETNIEISKVAARSYYTSLVEGETDIGDILLKMAIDLESISYQDSFHGAFSSANAAISLIIQRIDQL